MAWATLMPTESMAESEAVSSQSRLLSGKQMSDLWATPNARDAHNPSESDSERARRKRDEGWMIDLNEQAAWWNVAHAEHSYGGGAI